MRTLLRYSPAFLVAALAAVAAVAEPADTKAPAGPAFTAEQLAFYDKEVLPVLKENCLKCHGEGKTRGGLVMKSRKSLLTGGDTGPAVDLQAPEKSLILKALSYKDDHLRMPPAGKLADKDRATLEKWVKAGAPMPAGAEIVVEEKGGKVTPESKNWWAYRPLTRPDVPAVKDKGWVVNPIDAFILAKLEAKGLTPAAPADRLALLRRVHYDLTGLPPSPEEIDAFAADTAPDAYEKVVDRLLASPHYGEKWGRHWLDLVRYAETHGYERDSAKPFAWRYRDYVIDAFNKDKPYDVFIREQLAGDELQPLTAEALTATGYYRLGLWDDEPADRALARYDMLDGVVSTTAQVFMGMTVGCARCHDHKKDPIPQRDYYRLLAFFHDIKEMNKDNLRKVAPDPERRAAEAAAEAERQREAEVYAAVYRAEQAFAAALAEKKGVAAAPEPDLVDLSYRFYRDTWERLPDFDALKPEDTGKLAAGFVSTAVASRQEAFGLVFEGKLRVPEKGEHTFALESSDGARLLVDGKAVLDRPAKGKQSAAAKVTLPAGLVPVRLEYFNTYTKPALTLTWSGPGVPERALTGGNGVFVPDARRQAVEWSYLTGMPAANWAALGFDDTAWKKGPGGFGGKGAAAGVARTPWRGSELRLRKTFVVDGPVDKLALTLCNDADCEVFLNGTPVAKVPDHGDAYHVVPLGADAVKALKPGVNVLAVLARETDDRPSFVDVGLGDGRPTLADLLAKHGAELMGAEAYKAHREQRAKLEEVRTARPPEPGMSVMSVEERGRAETFVLIRGNPGAHGEKVQAGFPEVLAGPSPAKVTPPAKGTTSGKRLALAEWLVAKDNPATVRALANRLWQYHFGRGIVPTSNDFGKLGELPTHPELLDWLAVEVRDGGWTLKRMHKLILMSNAYRMASKASDAWLRADPANALFWRYNMRRLQAEEVRDSVLWASGKLNLKAGGPPVYPPIPREVLAGQSRPGEGWPKSPPDEASRRTVYVHIKRSLQVPVLAQHDQADTDQSCPVRYTTTVPTQALGMLNGAFTNEQAGFLAERVRKEHADDLEAQVRRVIRLTTGRAPAKDEVAKDVAFVKAMRDKAQLDDLGALRQYCLLALNTNEFIYLD